MKYIVKLVIETPPGEPSPSKWDWDGYLGETIKVEAVEVEEYECNAGTDVCNDPTHT